MQTNEEFIRERRKLFAEGNYELAEIRRRARNRLVMAPYQECLHRKQGYLIGSTRFVEESNAGRTFARRLIVMPEIEAEDVDE